MTRRASSLGLLLIVLFLPGCAQSPPPIEAATADASRERTVVSDGWLAMGTFFEADLRVAPQDVRTARAWLDWARLEIARLEAIFSRHDPQTELSALNRALAASNKPRSVFRLGVELEEILMAARTIWRESNGAFDPTVGPVLAVWRAAAAEGAWPSDQVLRRARSRVGSERWLLSLGGDLAVTTDGLQIDLDGLSKGVVLDRLRDRLVADLPEASALIHFGESSLVAIGDPEGRPVGGGWRLEVHSRGEPPRRLSVVSLRDRALSVSSSVGQVRQIEGRVISHVVDPRSGLPVPGEVEAIVIADRAGLADGWSTALLVLGGASETIARAERAGIEAALFGPSGSRVSTASWKTLEQIR